MRAEPAPCMTDLTSAKSRLIRPGVVMRSVMPWTPESSTWSAERKASSMRDGAVADRQQPVVGDDDEGVDLLAEVARCPASAWLARRRPSKVNGRVTTPMVSAPRPLAILATTGAPPVPVPPPSPAVTKTMSAPLRTSSISSAWSSAAFLPTSGSAPGAEAAGELAAHVELDVGVAHEQRLRVGVDGDELDALEADLDHAVDGVDATAADADDLDDGQVVLRCCHVGGPLLKAFLMVRAGTCATRRPRADNLNVHWRVRIMSTLPSQTLCARSGASNPLPSVSRDWCPTFSSALCVWLWPALGQFTPVTQASSIT